MATPGLAIVASAVASGNTLSGALALSLLPAVLLAGSGLLLFTAGVSVHVFGPLRQPAAARDRAAGYGTILGSLYLSFLISNIATISFLLLVRFLGWPVKAGLLLGGGQGDVSLLIVGALSQELALLSILYVRIVRPGIVTWREMGLGLGALGNRVSTGLLTAIGVLAVIGISEYLLSLAGVRQTQADVFAPLRRATPLQFALMLFAASLLAGFVEECFFRGYVFQVISRVRGPGHAYIASATVFAAAHVNWQAFGPFLLAGLLLAFVFSRTRSVMPAIVAHVVNNGVGLAVLYFAMA